MSRIRLRCQRDVSASLDEPADDTDACVVACPPHPELGGTRSDPRLQGVADALVSRGVACLRFDYGEWDEGRGERRDAGCALDWAGERYEGVGLFGYSFGAAVALLVAAERDDVAVVAALAPADRLSVGSDVASAVGAIATPTLVAYGTRDDTVDWQPVVEAAGTAGHRVDELAADHHFVGQGEKLGEHVASFVTGQL